MKLSQRTSKCLDFETFQKVVTGPNKSTPMDFDNPNEYTGFATVNSHGNEIGVFRHNKKDSVIISMVRHFKDGGMQTSNVTMSVDAAKCVMRLLEKNFK